MDSLPLHPKLVHLPMALAMLMPLITGGLLLAWWREWLPRRAWWVAVFLQVALMGGAAGSYITGEGDEGRVEPVVGEAPIEAHEEAATVFLIGAGVTTALVIAAALLPLGLAKGAAGLAVVATLAVLWLGVAVGEAGGRLVYQHNAGAAFSSGGGAQAPPAHDHRHD